LALRHLAHLAAIAISVAAPAQASPRETLVRVAFATTDKKAALAAINQVLAGLDQAVKRTPGDREALLQRAIAIGYRAQLTRSAGDAKAARAGFEALVARRPTDAEALLGLASWHLCSVADLGSLLAGAALGARKKDGLAYLDRALASGGNRALFPAYAALLRLRVSSKDAPAALRLSEQAIRAATPTAVDQALKQRAERLLPALRAGRNDQAADLAETLLPLGQVRG
jgi:hypothetical protein